MCITISQAPTPSDTADLTQGIKALRIWNPSDEPAVISLVTVKGTEVSLVIPAASLWVEAVRATAVKATGTSPGLIIHGYTD